jgi:valyl-tRNA synthetase
VKLTPAHDANDFAAGQRLGLPSINIMDEQARLNENAGSYAGLDRDEARKKIVEQLELEGLLVKTVAHDVPLGRCQRCKTPVEPRLSMQWFVRIKPLADPAIEAVEKGDIRFVPESWSKTYFEWMRNIRDWCISRQLWWGHRIPAWTCASCKEMIVAREDPTACAKCGGKELHQETDVLDTWFSSGLFPFSTLGWPEKTADLQTYYPNTTMMTGFDIIFFWVARMIMFGLRFAGDVPFRTVYMNGLVRDKHGKKMSKTAGNSVDPLEMVDKYGADALRFTLTALASAGNDPKLDIERLEGYGKFVNKLWNASRFTLMNLEGEIAPSYRFEDLPLPSRWIVSRTQAVAASVAQSLADYRFDQVANDLYHFVWHDFCDWYIELSKGYFADAKQGPTTRRVLLETLDAILKMLHPIMPFVTEEIWQRIPHEGASIMVAAFPKADAAKRDAAADAEMERLQQFITEIRTIRATYEVEPRRRIDVTVVAVEAADRAFLERHQSLIKDLARIETFAIVPAAEEVAGTIKHPVGPFDLRIPRAGLFDMAAEKTRLSKERLKLDAELEALRKKLSNAQFVERGKPEVVAQNRERVTELEMLLAKIETTLRELGGA